MKVCAAIGLMLLGACSRPGPTADSAFAIDMLAQLNNARASATPTPSPALAPLTWSQDAANVAQGWADGCKYEHNLGQHQYGENIAASAPAGSRTNAFIVGEWTGEVADYDYATNTCAEGKECGHYLQVVSRRTVRVGCAKATCHDTTTFGAGFPDWDYWVCDFEPSRSSDRPY